MSVLGFFFSSQESEKGSWHVPLANETNDDSLRTWLCINRPEGSRNDEIPEPTKLDSADKPEMVSHCNTSNGSSVTGKRKER